MVSYSVKKLVYGCGLAEIKGGGVGSEGGG